MITATEMTIAARMHGMEYGQFSFALECGVVTMPPMEEIRKRIVKPKRQTTGAKGGRPVCQYDRQGEFVRSYETAYAAAAAMGREKHYNILAACDGRYLKAYGFQWRYMDEDAPGPLECKKRGASSKEHWVEQPCKNCGKMYKGPKNSRYCSDECKYEANRKWQRKYCASLEKKPRKQYTKRCAYCGTEFVTDVKKRIYCTTTCNARAYQRNQRERRKAQNRK